MLRINLASPCLFLVYVSKYCDANMMNGAICGHERFECWKCLVIFGELHKFVQNRKINAIVMT